MGHVGHVEGGKGLVGTKDRSVKGTIYNRLLEAKVRTVEGKGLVV